MTSALAAQKVFTEIHCLETLQHSHVIKLLGVKNADTHMVLVFEYAGGGDLKQYLEARRTSSDGPVTEEEACDMFRAIVDGVSYCHKKNIVHRDLKLDNILLTTESENSGDNGGGNSGGEAGDGGGDNNSGKSSRSPSPITSGESQRIANGIKVADFGLSSIYRPGNASTSKAGSLPYMAPEVLGDQEFLGPPCDVWSLGVILFALVCGRLPFDGDSYNEVKQRVIEGKYTFTDQERSHLSHEVKDLLSKVLRRHPNERIGVGGMINHPWMEKYAQYTVRRISGMNFPIHNVDDTTGRKSRSSSVISVNSVMSGEEKIESGDNESSRDSVRTRYTPSPPVKPRSPPSKGRIIMQQQQQQLKKSASVGSLVNQAATSDQGRATSSFRSPSPTFLRNSAGISSMSLGGRAISPVSSSHQRLIRTMNETNQFSSSSRFSGTPPRGPSLRTGWSTPTGSQSSSPIKISSSSSGAATTTTPTPTTPTPNRSTLTNNPSPQSSPIPLSLFEQRINSSSAPTSSASSSSSNHPGGTSGLFIHEGQAESFQRVQTTSSSPLSTSLSKEKLPHVSTKM